MKFAKLRGRIYEKYGSIGKFADAAGISRVSMSLKLSGRIPFSKEQMAEWSSLLGISKKDIGIFFFE